MNTHRFVHAAAMLLLSLWVAPLAAHGLHMTTVQVTQRQENHLIVTVHTSPSALFNAMDYPDKPGSLMYLANGSDQQIEQFRTALLSLLRAHMKFAVAQRPLEHVVIRIPADHALRELLLQHIAAQVLHASPDAPHSGDRSSYLRIDVDGFLPRRDGPRVLQATFPKELGRVLVSYTEPQVQTLTPSEGGSTYIQPLR